MTRKDFQLIADTIRTAKIPHECRATLAASFALTLAATNPHFDANRFAAACIG